MEAFELFDIVRIRSPHLNDERAWARLPGLFGYITAKRDMNDVIAFMREQPRGFVEGG
jgi:hypothetical protein